MSAIDFWVAEHRARAPRLPGAALPWLAGLRERAIQRFADDPKVTIVLDRRCAERRQRHDRPAIDRRRAERRAGGHAGEDDLVPQGYFIVDL